MSKSKKILIISYYFPPNNSIAGRRWAKFAKELHKRGHDIRVLTFNNSRDTDSNWEKDIVSYQDRIIQLKEFFQNPFNYQYTWWHKAKYKLALMSPKLFPNGKKYKRTWIQKFKASLVKAFVKGAYSDKTVFLEKEIRKHVTRAIKEGYNNVVVTCPPYRQGYYISKLIKEYPLVNFIADFRDPWANNHGATGLVSLSQDRVEFEKELEGKVVSSYGKIVVVAEEMRDYFVKTYNLNSEKVKVIHNGFDVDDFPSKNEIILKEKSDKIRVVFTGTFYGDKTTVALLEKLAMIIDGSEKFKNTFQFHFYGTVSDTVKKVIDRYSNFLFFHGQIKLREVYRVISDADFCSLFLMDNINYSFSTKFLEYVSQNKKIIVFSNGGSTGEFVEQQKIGFNAISNKLEQVLERVIKTYNDGNRPYEYNANEFSLSALTTQYEKLLI